MKRVVISGFLFIAGVMMICTMFIVLSNIDSNNYQGSALLWPGAILLIIGIYGFISSKETK